MAKKRKVNFLFIIMLIVFACAVVVCESPYIGFEKGSFLRAVMDGIYPVLVKYVGYFKSGAIAEYTLLPAVLFIGLLTADCLFKSKFLTVVSHILAFPLMYVVLGYFQIADTSWLSGLLPEWYFWPCAILLLACIFRTVFVQVRAVKKAVASAVRNRKPKKEKPFDIEKYVKEKALSMTVSDALDALTGVTVPEFDTFKNVDLHEEYTETTSVGDDVFEQAMADSGVIIDPEKKARTKAKQKEKQEDREYAVKREKLSKAFKVKKEPEEDPSQGDLFASFEGSDFKFKTIEIPKQDEIEVEAEEANEPVSEPENNKEVRISQPKTIIEESSIDEDSEEDLEKAKKEYDQMQYSKGQKISQDLISAVGGLKSAKDGAYLYDSSKLTYKFPPESLLKHYPQSVSLVSDIAHDHDGQTIVETLSQFRIDTQLIGIQHGPTFTLYELTLGKGVRVASVQSLSDNIAMDLAVQSVRILAPIPGKSAIGIEVPNKKRDTIGFDLMIPALKSKELRIPMVLGKTITGDSIVIDLAGTPHLLVAGTTGSGKSVCINSLICSVLYTKTPKQVRMILVDPKMVELSVYNDIPHLLTPVITDPKKAIKVMAFIVEEMERRMSMFSQVGARKIDDYNEKIVQKGFLRAQLPYIMVVIDEFADLMTVVGKELESYIKRITAVARFTGIHLVLATQRPSADVITGIIKSNMPTQIAFAVSNQLNSRIILDSLGAEKLLGKGDMLYASASNRTPQRIQGAFIDPEIESIVKFVKTQGQPDYIDESYFEDDEDTSADEVGTVTQGSEDMFTRAWKIVAERGEASASFLQRRLSIGYNKAANLIEQLEEAGYIGPARGSKPREILVYPDPRNEG